MEKGICARDLDGVKVRGTEKSYWYGIRKAGVLLKCRVSSTKGYLSA